MDDAAPQHDGSDDCASQDPDEGADMKDSGTNDGASMLGDWRKTAELIQQERDPVKLFDLADQLMNELDKNESLASSQAEGRSVSAGGCTSEGQQQGASQDGEHRGTTRPTR